MPFELLLMKGGANHQLPAKTAGGVTTKEENILKWCLNRSEQAKNTRALQDLCGIGTDTGIYKPTRPSQIVKSEKLVSSVMKVLTEVGIDKDVLVCISSGLQVSDEVAENILELPEMGRKQHAEFVESRLQKNAVSFHNTIKTNVNK